MGNPQSLLCDSDVLTQLFLGNEIRPLKELKAKYGIQSLIAQEVETEAENRKQIVAGAERSAQREAGGVRGKAGGKSRVISQTCSKG